MELLLLLVENRGRLVTREQIAERLWKEPQTVDVVQGINAAVKRLRSILNDDPAAPRFVETVIGKGYRFIAEIEDSPVAVTTSVIAEPPTTAPPAQEPPRMSQAARWKWTVAAVSLSVAVLGAAFLPVYRDSASTVMPKPVFARVTANDTDNRVTASAISPDGRLLAYADQNGISLRVVASGAEHQLASPPALRVDRITWFADDLRLAVSGYAGADLKPQIWTVFVTGERPRLIRDLARNGVPSPDGRSFAFTGAQDEDIRVGDTNGEEAHVLVRSGRGQSFPFILWSADSRLLLYQRKSWAPPPKLRSDRTEPLEGNYRWSYEAAESHDGRVLASTTNFRFDSACLIPGNRILFLQWIHAGRDIGGVLWEAEYRSSNGSFDRRAQRILNFEHRASSISASSDGREIAAVLEKDHSDVYVAALRHPGPQLTDVRRLTHDLQSDYPHAWTPDSNSVIFESDRAGRFEIYSQPVDGNVATLVASLPRDSVLPQVAPGGKWVLFASEKPGADGLSGPNAFAIYRVPLTGGPAELLYRGGTQSEFRCPLARAGRCVLRETLGHEALVYYELDPQLGKGRELGRTAWSPVILGDWDVSPDGSAVALPIHNESSRTIRIVPLGAARAHAKERSVVVDAWAGVSGVTWAADGRGFFAGVSNDTGSDLLYVDMEGHATVLRQTVTGIWGVPSPDGSKLAFVDHTIDSNVWLSGATAEARNAP